MHRDASNPAVVVEVSSAASSTLEDSSEAFLFFSESYMLLSLWRSGQSRRRMPIMFLSNFITQSLEASTSTDGGSVVPRCSFQHSYVWLFLVKHTIAYRC